MRHIVNIDSITDPDLTNDSIPYNTSPKHDSTATLLSINHLNFIEAIRAIKSSMCLVCLHNLAKVSLYVLYCLVFELLLLFLVNRELNQPFLSFLNKFRILYLALLETTLASQDSQMYSLNLLDFSGILSISQVSIHQLFFISRKVFFATFCKKVSLA